MTNSYDNQKLYGYLLGTLPDEDVEHLDELTFTDPNFAESVDVAEKDLVDSYVNGELSGDTLERFESHFLASPVRRDKVQFARAFREFADKEVATEMASNADAAVAPPVDAKEKSLGFFEALGAWGRELGLAQFATAAAVLVLLGIGGVLLFRGLNGRSGGDEIASKTNQISPTPASINSQIGPTPIVSESPAVNAGSNVKPETSPAASPTPHPTPKPLTQETHPTIATVVLLPPLRGGQKLAQVPLSRETSAAAFTLNLEASEYGSYRLELVDQDTGRRIWQVSSLKAQGKGDNKSLSARVPAKLFRSQVYSFAVSGIAKDGTTENIGDYAFRIVR